MALRFKEVNQFILSKILYLTLRKATNLLKFFNETRMRVIPHPKVLYPAIILKCILDVPIQSDNLS